MQLNMCGETIESLLYRENKPILELKISYPQIMGPLSQKSEYRFNDYYCKQARNLNRQARTEFYHRASEEARIAGEQEYDFTLHSLIRTFTTMRLNSRYTSVVFDRYQYSGGTHGTTVRIGNTWDFSTGTQVPLSYFFYKNSPYRNVILKLIREQIEQLKKREEILFFENPLRNARQCFSEANYYLTNDAVVIFYPLYTLAPYYAGILTYKIPFNSLDGCWIKDRKPSEIPPYTGGFTARFGNELL